MPEARGGFLALTRKEAAALVKASDGHLCARITRGSNGKIRFRTNPAFEALGRWARVSLITISGLAAAAAAQETSGRCAVRVQVTDSSGGHIPGATVAMQSAEGLAVSGIADKAGVYRSEFASGKYAMSISAPGFKAERRNVQVSCAGSNEWNVRLAVGAVGATIIVEAIPLETKPPRSTGPSSGQDF